MIAKEETIKLRKEICNSCEFKKEILGIDKCGSCGCLLSVKTKFSTMYCPEGKWKQES